MRQSIHLERTEMKSPTLDSKQEVRGILQSVFAGSQLNWWHYIWQQLSGHVQAPWTLELHAMLTIAG
jgi:hypothetical protein